MDVRKLGEGPRSNKPDRSKATLDKGRSLRNTEPQQQPLPPAKNADSKQFENRSDKTPKTHSRRTRTNSWDRAETLQSSKAPPWIAGLLAITTALCLVVLLIALIRPEPETAPVEKAGTASDIETEIALMDLKLDEGPQPYDIALKFVTTADPAERLQMARDPERVAALIPEFPEQAVSEIASHITPMGEVLAGQLSIARFKAHFERGKSRILFVIRTEEGPLVDWEAFARHSDALQRWMKEAKASGSSQTVETAEVRIHAIQDSYYNFGFSDESKWRSYQIAGPDLDEIAVGYAEVGSKTARILDELLAVEMRMTLEIKSSPENARKRQFQIEKVLAIGWVKGEGDFEEKWLSSHESLGL